jgi:phospholipid/cholesterol/gamma-HCH transport system substrate-binding protein
MNNAQQSIRVGFFFLLGVALIWVTFETLNGGHFFADKGYRLTAGFDDLKELKAGDEVRMAGVKIGTVEKTQLNELAKAGPSSNSALPPSPASAILRINPEVKIQKDATASIVQSGLLGNNYLAITIGTPGAGTLGDGDQLATTVTPDFNSVMKDIGDLGHKLDGALSSLTGIFNGNGDKDGGLFQKLDKMITDNRDKVTATMTNLQDITTKVNQGQGTLGKLINDPDLHDQLLAAVSQIKDTAAQAKDFVANAQGVMDQIKSGKGALGEIVYDQQTADNIKASIQNVRDVSDKLAKGEGTLGKLINDDSLYTTAQNTLNKADRAIDGLNDSGPITAVGIAANALF